MLRGFRREIASTGRTSLSRHCRLSAFLPTRGNVERIEEVQNRTRVRLTEQNGHLRWACRPLSLGNSLTPGRAENALSNYPVGCSGLIPTGATHKDRRVTHRDPVQPKTHLGVVAENADGDRTQLEKGLQMAAEVLTR
jgi:hypothetical protein